MIGEDERQMGNLGRLRGKPRSRLEEPLSASEDDRGFKW
jgi:hypothetical protein